MIKSAGRICFLNVDEIDWIEAADYYVQLHVGACELWSKLIKPVWLG
jgi:hypothetical protein